MLVELLEFLPKMPMLCKTNLSNLSQSLYFPDEGDEAQREGVSSVEALESAPGGLTPGRVCSSLLWFDFSFNWCLDRGNLLKYLQPL